MKLSVLDLSPVLSGRPIPEALQDSLELARFVDEVGYYRYWFAEHHNMEGIATTSPEIMINYVASVTKNLRVGSGGIMLPNHSPLKIAENFRTLLALHPGKIDLGLGRAPGSDMKTAFALRRSDTRVRADSFTEELHELLNYLDEGYQGIKAMPTVSELPDIWLLGSSDFSARLAAKSGLPFSFADHFSTYPAKEIIDIYKNTFIPSKYLSSPRCMLGTHIICAETDEEAEKLALSSDYSFYRLRQLGRSEPLISVQEAENSFTPEDWKLIRSIGMKKFVGSPSTIRQKISSLLKETQVDEIIVTSFIYDQSARKKSYRLLFDELSLL